MFRVVTVAREYGSGGGRIAQLLANRLGWKLLDRCLVEKIAENARIEPQVAEKFDERPDPWFDRLANVFWQSPGLRGYIGAPFPDRFDADVAAHLTHRVIEEAAEIGDCVIVGRGSQCILQQREDAFHVFIYAPRGERVARLLRRDPRLSKAEAEKKLVAEDAIRAAYVRLHFGEDWQNRHLYHLMISSVLGEKEVVSIILSALHAVRVGAPAATR
ncbi:MAG TPA: cytidylate kinase-like family protein [Terriglobia bacterium]|nr:cytidylate kinase-like family protein [Terriglobia bacterium]